MAQLLEIYRKDLINLDYADVLTQRAYLALYGGLDSAGNGVLQRFIFDSATNVTTGGSAADGEWLNVIDVDFDVTIKAPQIMEGTGYVNITFGQVCDNTNSSLRCRARLAYYRGSTETIIATSGYATGQNGTTYDDRTLLQLTIPITSLKIGDILRLIIEADVATDPEYIPYVCWIGHDPGDSSYTSGDDGTLLKAWIPFKPVI